MREMAWHRLKNAIIAISKSSPENLPVSDLWVCAVKVNFKNAEMWAFFEMEISEFSQCLLVCWWE
jgi:hypothetical protein